MKLEVSKVYVNKASGKFTQIKEVTYWCGNVDVFDNHYKNKGK